MIHPNSTRVIPDPKTGKWLAVIGDRLTTPVHETRADAWVYIVHVQQGWVHANYVTKRVRLEPITERVRLE